MTALRAAAKALELRTNVRFGPSDQGGATDLRDNDDYFGIRGKSNGIEIEVIVDGNGDVVTSYPTPRPDGVKENPDNTGE